MPVDTPQIKFTPYTPTVPQTEVPVQEMQAGTTPAPPIPGQFGRKGTGALAIGDSIFKGLMMGHQVKEARKHAEAETTIAAADAATERAFADYQNTLTQSGGNVNDPKSQAAYKAYLDVFNKGKEAKAQFVIPEKPKVQTSRERKKGLKGEIQSGFSNIHEFFAANPHVIPEIALLTMQPKPPGMTQESQGAFAQRQLDDQAIEEGKLKLSEMKKMDEARNVVAMYGSLSPEEFSKLDHSLQEKYRYSKSLIEESSPKQKYNWFVDTAGNFHSLAEGEEPPAGWKLYSKPTAGMVPKVGTEQFMVSNYLSQHGFTDPAQAPPSLLKYLHDWWSWKQAQTTAGSTGTTVDIHGNRVTTTKSTRSAPEPKPANYGLSNQFQAPSTGEQPSKVAAPPQAPSNMPAYAPTGATEFTATPKPKGMVEEGNLPIWNRPTVQNADGTHSSEYSVSFQDDQGREVLVPTVVDGKFLTPDGKKPPEGSPEEKEMFKRAWQHYLDTGQNLGKFDNPTDADAYAERLHARQQAPTAPRTRVARPPQRPAAAAGGRRVSAPPRTTLTDVTRTQKIETEQSNRYAKAEDAYNKAVEANQKAYQTAIKNGIPEEQAKGRWQEAQNRALQSLQTSKAEVAKWYDAQIKALGGTPGDKVNPPPSGNKPDTAPPGATTAYRDPKTNKVVGWAVNGQYVPVGNR